MNRQPVEPCLQPQSELRFGRFRLQPVQRQLFENDVPVKLGGRAFDVLWALVERRDRAVPKSELMQLAWPKRVVEENNLQVQVVTLRKLLGPAAITTIPGRGYQFSAALDGAIQPTPAQAAVESSLSTTEPPTNLPAQLQPLYGRDEDLARLSELIEQHLLVSVVGPSGLGKTRMAQAAAWGARDDFADGVWVVELASIADPALAISAVARALDVQLGAEPKPVDLAAILRGRRMLLVVDNCEHLLDAVAEIVTALRREAPSVRVLATSQEPLRLAGEQVYRLGTLALPENVPLDVSRHIGAVALFVARAQAVAPAFVLTQGTLPIVVDICRRLDGIALAIELAAARVPLLGVDGLRAKLDDRFRVLTAGSRLALRRHQTLRAALEWSHGLLTPDEQTVFRRLGVFTGTFGLESAQRVASAGTIDEWSVLEILGALVDKSLVVVEAGSEPRYRLLESGRAYALERLADSGERDAVLRQHAQALLAIFDRSRDEYWTTTSGARIDRYAAEIDNLRAALDWAAEAGEADLSIALTGASSWLWRDVGLHAEGLRRCDQAIRLIGPATPLRLEARLHNGYLELGRNRSLAAGPALASGERAIELYRQLSDRQELYVALAECARTRAAAGDAAGAEAMLAEVAALYDQSWPLGLKHPMLSARSFIFTESHRVSEARAAWEERLQLERALGDTRFATVSLTNLIDAVFAEGDVAEAIARGRELVALIRRDRMTNWQSFAVANLSAALTAAGQLDEALQLAREALPLLRQQGSIWSFLDHLGLLALKRGRPFDAAQVLGCADELNQRSGYVRQFNERRARDQLLEALRASVKPGELARLMKEGGSLTADEAARLALAT
ncbi:MAG: winged helix-turn-helix domain-containing protein [Burkholderiaceae bacterium]|nr:winged helix-turn-helix domain-containing protein [Burkholderiaceae bacterium]